jgi:NAD+ kinase
MTFGIRGNISKPELAAVVLRLIKSLERSKTGYLLEKSIAALLKKKFNLRVPAGKVTADKNLSANSDYLVSIGGDGTFLATAKLVGSRNIPIIGVNLGKLGFLAETATAEINAFIRLLQKGKFMTDERTVLAAKEAGGKRYIYGMNEIVVNQSGIVKTVEILVYYNNQLVNRYHADGLIISTPTGSTGYSLSAGGPIVFPKTDVFILSPLMPHTLTARPVILPDSGVFKIKVNAQTPINIVADGNSIIKLRSPAVIVIKKAPYKIKIAKSLKSNYFKVLTGKLLWGEDKRKKSRI